MKPDDRVFSQNKCVLQLFEFLGTTRDDSFSMGKYESLT